MSDESAKGQIIARARRGRKMADAPISRIQWSKRGITAYDENGSFVFRLEGWMTVMFTAGIVATLGRIEQERVRRVIYKPEGATTNAIQCTTSPSIDSQASPADKVAPDGDGSVSLEDEIAEGAPI